MKYFRLSSSTSDSPNKPHLPGLQSVCRAQSLLPFKPELCSAPPLLCPQELSCVSDSGCCTTECALVPAPQLDTNYKVLIVVVLSSWLRMLQHHFVASYKEQSGNTQKWVTSSTGIQGR